MAFDVELVQKFREESKEKGWKYTTIINKILKYWYDNGKEKIIWGWLVFVIKRVGLAKRHYAKCRPQVSLWWGKGLVDWPWPPSNIISTINKQERKWR